MHSVGVIREFHPDEGWGVIDAPEVPGGCWVHFSAISMDGYRELAAGQDVSFRAEAVQQDGFGFRAVRVWLDPVEPTGQPDRHHSSGPAYHSVLTLSFDPPADPPADPGTPVGA